MATRNRTDGRTGKVFRDARTGRMQVRPDGAADRASSSEIEYAADDVVDAAVADGKVRWAELLRRLGE